MIFSATLQVRRETYGITDVMTSDDFIDLDRGCTVAASVGVIYDWGEQD